MKRRFLCWIHAGSLNIFGLTKHLQNEIDGDFTTAGSSMDAPYDNANVRGYRVPKIPKLGSYTSVRLFSMLLNSRRFFTFR